VVRHQALIQPREPRDVAGQLLEQDGQLRLLAKAADDNMRAYLLTGWLAGLRLSEAANLEWTETTTAPYLDFDKNRIILPAEIVKAVEDQWIPIDPVLKAALLALPRHGRKVFHFVDTRRGKEGRRLTLSGISDRVTDLAKKAGVRLTMHSLRKGFGCRYAGKVSAHVLMRLMRHANIRTTLDYYANFDSAVEEAILGSKCNSECNTPPQTATTPQTAGDETPDA
jgi:integrase